MITEIKICFTKKLNFKFLSLQVGNRILFSFAEYTNFNLILINIYRLIIGTMQTEI